MPIQAANAAVSVVDARLAVAPSLSLTDQFAVLEDAGAALTVHDLQRSDVAARFKTGWPVADALNFGYSRSAYWLRLSLDNPGDLPLERVLEVRYPGLSSVEFHQPEPGGAFRLVATGSVKPFATREHASRYFVFPLTLPAHAQQTLYLRVLSNGPISIPAYLWKPEAFRAYERTDYMIQSWYFGVAAAMLVYNLLLFIALWDVSYLLYVAFVACMALTNAVQAGLAKEFLWNDAPLWSNIAASVGYSLSLATLLVFMRHMLKTQKVIAHSDRLILPLVGLFLVAPVAFSISLTTFIKPAAYLYAGTGVLILAIGLWCIYKRQRSAYYFVTAFAVLCLAAIASVLRAMDLLPTNYLTVNALQLGSGLEMLLLAFALADRFNEIRAERARAQAYALQAQQRVVDTLQRSELLLAERVQQRTRELDQKNAALTQAMSSLETVQRISRHDLKTPLGALVAAPAMLRAGRHMSEREETVLRMMENAAARALQMVNLSLDIFHMESGSYVYKPTRVDLRALVALVVQDLGAQAASKAVRLRVETPQQPVLANAEERLCYPIIANILKNAVEAAPAGTEVCVTLQQALDASVGIHNQGAVPFELRKHFFSKYSTSGKEGGTGLGTYSSHLLACAQGGSLSMETSNEAGTTLTLRLTAWQPQATDGCVATPAPDDGVAQGADARMPFAWRVLVVDDDEFNRMVLLEQMAQPPLLVESAINGREALEIVQLRRPDLIFMDIEMPVLGGVEAQRLIRAFQIAARQKPSTIVAYSGNSDEQSRAHYLSQGFDHCLSKPASRPQLLSLLGSLNNSTVD